MTPTTGSFTITGGGPLAASTAAISAPFTAAAVLTALTATGVLPANVEVTLVSFVANLLTIQFSGLSSNPGLLTVSNSTNAASFVVATTAALDYRPTTTTSLTKATANSRLVLNNSASDYRSSVTVTSGALRVSNAADLGSLFFAPATAVTVSSTGVLEIAAPINIYGTARTLSLTGSGIAGTSADAGNLGVVNAASTVVNNGAVRVLSGASLNWNPGVATGASTVIATESGTNVTLTGVLNPVATTLFKTGGGTLVLGGPANNTATGALHTYQGTVVLNKSGTGQAFGTGALIVGDGIGGDDADRVLWGSAAGSTSTTALGAVTVLSSGEYDASPATNATNEIQQLTFASNVTSGSFTITYNGQNSTSIPWSSIATTLIDSIQTGLNNLFGAGNTVVSMAAGTTVAQTVFTITFTGNLANANLNQVTITSSTLNGGGVAPSTVLNGMGNEVQQLTLVGANPDTVQLSFNGVNATSTLPAPFAATTATAIQTNLGTIAALTNNITVLGANGGPYTIVFRNTQAGINQNNISVVGTGTAAGSAVSLVSDGIGIAEVQQLLFDPTVNGGSFVITYNGQNSTPISWNASTSTLVGNINAGLVSIFGAGNAVAASLDGLRYTITFTLALANANLAPVTITSSLTTGNAVVTTPLAVATLQDGVGNTVFTYSVSGVAGSQPAYNGVAGTALLAFAANTTPTAAQVLASLNAIPSLTGNVAVIGPDGGGVAAPFTVVFLNNLASRNIPAAALTTAGGTAAWTPVSAGFGNEIQVVTNVAGVTSFTYQFEGFTTPSIAVGGSAAITARNFQNALDALPSVGAGNSIVTPISTTVFNVSFENALSHRDVVAAVPTGTGGTSTPSSPVTGVVNATLGATVTLGMNAAGAGDLVTGASVLSGFGVTVIGQAGAYNRADHHRQHRSGHRCSHADRQRRRCGHRSEHHRRH